MTTKNDIFSKPGLLFAWAPSAIFAFPHIFLVVGGYETWVMPTPREGGFVENCTALFFLFGGVYALYLIGSDAAKQVTFFRAALLLFGLTAVWVCLEEVSYGQYFLNYRTPEWFIEHNKNREFNLHNLGQDMPAHALKTAGYALVSIVGIIAPLTVYFMKIRFSVSTLLFYFIPTTWMVVPSLFHLFANLPKNITKALPGGDEFIDSSYYFSESGEYEEYMLGVWVFLYVFSIHTAIRKRSGAALTHTSS